MPAVPAVPEVDESHAAAEAADGEAWEEPEAVEMEITDVLDLHSFPPRDVKALVKDYLELAHAKGLRQLRIIHGKGVGTQRRMVRSILQRHPRVVDFGDPPGEAGGWGATCVTLR